jgi:hypothetical protein
VILNVRRLAELKHRYHHATISLFILLPESELIESSAILLRKFKSVQFVQVKSKQAPGVSYEAYLNHLSHQLSTDARETFLDSPTKLVPMPGRAATLLLNNLEVSADYRTQIRAMYSSQALRIHFQSKYSWNDPVIDDIDWHCHGSALQLLRGRKRKSIQQFIHRWLPVNAHPSQAKQGTAKRCPYCETHDETHSHFLGCHHPLATKQRQQAMKNISKQLVKRKTDTVLFQLLTHAILDWADCPRPARPAFVTPPYYELFERQSLIDWNQVIHGQWSLAWVQVYDTLNQSKLDGKEWSILIINQIWQQVDVIWKHRCQMIHGDTTNQQHQQLLN